MSGIVYHSMKATPPPVDRWILLYKPPTDDGLPHGWRSAMVLPGNMAHWDVFKLDLNRFTHWAYLPDVPVSPREYRKPAISIPKPAARPMINGAAAYPRNNGRGRGPAAKR